MKKILIFLFFIFFLFSFGKNALAQSSVNIYFFWGEGCPHCAKEKSFLEKFEKKYPEAKIFDFEVWENIENRNLLIQAGKKLNADISGVPFTIIGDKYIIGYFNDETTGKEIENLVKYCFSNECPDIISSFTNLNISEEQNQNQEERPEKEINSETNLNKKEEKIISVPFFGKINAMNLSLPALTIILGALDGFNPCAMWALLFLISLLLGMQDRKRMWILGSAFIIASAFVYFVFMAAWLNLILFIGLIVWVRIIIGIVALLGGGYNLKEYFTNKNSTCKVTNDQKKQQIFEKLKNISQQKSFYLALGGIILLAFAVNLIELICSAGLPAVYTQVLVLSDLAKWQYYLYILLYIFVFMLDDLFVFFVAMTTLKITGVTSKYSRWSHLIGGILMIIIGSFLILKPEWLMFG